MKPNRCYHLNYAGCLAWLLLLLACSAARLRAQSLPAGYYGQQGPAQKALFLKRCLEDSIRKDRRASVPLMAHTAIGLAAAAGADSLLPVFYQNLADAYDGRVNDSAAYYYRKALSSWKSPRINKRIYLQQSLIYSYTALGRKDSIRVYIHALEQTVAPLADTDGRKLKVMNTLATAYGSLNDYTRAVQAFRFVIRQALPHKDSAILANALINTGTVYNETGNDTMAIYYTLQALPFLGSDEDVTLTAYGNLCDYYSDIGRPDSALFFLNKAEQLPGVLEDTGARISLGLHRATILVNKRQYVAAEPLLVQSLRHYSQSPGSLGQINTLMIYAQLDTGLHRYASAKARLLQLYSITRDKDAQAYAVYTLQLLAMIYEREGDYRSAYRYQQQYIALNDQIRSERAAQNFALLQTEYQTYRREEQISQLSKAARIKDLELQAARRERAWYLGLGLLLCALFGTFYYLRQQRARADLRQLKVSLEMKALRSQMNPHFIFNSLNSIQKYIWENRQEDAAEYLTRFARLIRLVLENSQHAAVPLQTELAALRLYIDMEHRRNNQKFDYRITVDETLDSEAILVPPLLIQPYVENAIWHGLSQKEERGLLTVAVSGAGNALTYTITDDGIGREAAGRIRAGSKSSLGMNISAERIDWLRRDTGQAASVAITDLYRERRPAGTRVILSLPLILKT